MSLVIRGVILSKSNVQILYCSSKIKEENMQPETLITEDQSDVPFFSREVFSLDRVSDEIRLSSRNNFSALLRKMGEVSLESIGDKLQLHKSQVCRMKESGDLAKVAAVAAAIGYDVVAMENEIKELRRQNAALQIIAKANLDLSASKLAAF